MEIKKMVSDHYGPITAKTYDQMAQKLFWAYNEVLEAVAFEIFFGRRDSEDQVPTIYTLLDIGMGTGNLSEKIIELYTQLVPDNSIKLDVVGFDSSSHMVDVAVPKLNKFKNINIENKIGKIEDTISLLSVRKFDCIVASFSIHHLDDSGKALLIKGLFGLLNEGGRLVIADRMPPAKNEKKQERDYYRVIASKFLDLAGSQQEEKPKLSEIIEELLNQFKEDGDLPSSIEEHLQWFIDGGFIEVRAPFHSFGCAVVSGIKPKKEVSL